jgi:hypothetical protein
MASRAGRLAARKVPRLRGPSGADERGLVLSGPLVMLSVAAVVLAGVAFVVTGNHGDRSVDHAGSPVAASAHSSGASSSGAARQDGSTPSKEHQNAPGAKAGTQKAASQKAKDRRNRARKAKQHDNEPAVRRAETYVEVYNNSGISGLAGATASKISGAGWQVVGSDNWYGTIPATTVYYPSRLEAQAKLLAKDLGIVRLRPAIAPMRFDRLTVILTGDYA